MTDLCKIAWFNLMVKGVRKFVKRNFVFRGDWVGRWGELIYLFAL
jgi:hypothetical protein